MGNICLHIASKKFTKVINEIPDVIEFLGEKDVIDKELSERLASIAKLRNLLVHQYWEIDDEKIYQNAKENLTDLEQFTTEVEKFVGIE